MSLHPATRPTRAFVTELVKISSDLEWDPNLLVGDHVWVEEHGQSGEIVAAVDGGFSVRLNGGPVVSVGEDDDLYLEDRPSLEALWETRLKAPEPEGVAVLEALPGTLLDRLRQGLEPLLAGRVDYHPGSGTIVRDLVHPSLYPLVRSAPPPPPPPPSDPEAQTPTEPAPKPGWLARLFGAQAPAPPVAPEPADRWKRPFESSIYQWLPTRFAIADDGAVRIVGPINNLPRDTHAPMYEALAELFQAMVPLFESACGYVDGLTFYNEALEGEHELPEASAELQPGGPAEPRRLRGSTVQVITKIVEYRLDEGETFEGVWHVEGMSHEHILATGVCTLKRDASFKGGDLRFKRAYTEEDAGALFWNVPQTRPTAIEDMVSEGHIPLGSIETREGRCFVFPNSHVHKLTDLASAGGTARRQVVVFWLVDPAHTITGMEDVPLPQSTMTYEQACEVRLALMEERRLHKQSHNVRAVSLCEH